MLSKAFSINFQPENSAVTLPSGWLKDTGATYADRGNGRSYGWSCDLSEDTRERLVHSAYRKRGNSSNPLLDTSIIFDRLEACATTYWSIALTPGVALSQDFRKFAKESKAGADQEKNSKMAGVAEKNPGFLAILQ